MTDKDETRRRRRRVPPQLRNKSTNLEPSIIVPIIIIIIQRAAISHIFICNVVYTIYSPFSYRFLGPGYGSKNSESLESRILASSRSRKLKIILQDWI